MKVSKTIACLTFFLATAPLLAQSPSKPQDASVDEMKERLDKLKARELELQKYSKATTVSPLTVLQATVKGTFWRNQEWVKLLDLSADQQKRMDDIFQQYRLKLVDLTASLRKEELILEPLLGGTRPAPEVETKILTQIDRIADARAELEKANSRMLVSILQVLTADQWSKLPTPTKKEVPVVKTPAK
jgi:Spy/CpxP family protein refolding chaperone